jgi:mono/diheme cytochrome c family protein
MRRIIPLAATAAITLTPLPAAAQDAEAGRLLYRDFCAACHGATARGDGVMRPVLTLAPPDLTRLAGDGAFPVLRIAEQIDGRRPMAAHGGDMPIFGRWFEGDGPDVALPGPGGQPVLMSRPVADLVTYLQSIQS